MKKRTKTVLIFCLIFSFLFHLGAVYWISGMKWKSFHGERFALASSGKEMLFLPKVIMDMTFKTSSLDLKQNLNFPMQFATAPLTHEKEKSIALPKLHFQKNLNFTKKAVFKPFIVNCNDSLRTCVKKILPSKTPSKFDLVQMIHQMAKNEEIQIFYNEPSSLITHTESRQEITPTSLSHMMGLINQLEFLSTTEVHFTDKETEGSLIQYPLIWKKHNFELPSSCFSFPTLKALNTVSYKDAFDLQVAYVPDGNGKYLFAATLIPKENGSQAHMKQNIIFLLDKSHSIATGRFDLYKHAIGASLQQLQDTQTFNILAFDNTIEFFKPNFSKKSADNIKQAKKFLLEQSTVSFLTTTDIFPVLKYIRSLRLSSHEQLTVILLSDSEFLTKRKNLLALELWTRTNKGPVSFFVLALDQDKNIPLLDYLTERNSGKVLLPHSDVQIKRTLCKLLRSTRMPLAKNMSFNCIAAKGQNVSFFPFQNKKSILFADQPYTLMGKVDSLEDFDLLLQGKNGSEFFSIKKRVSFKSAKGDEFDLVKQAHILTGYDYYEKFFTEKKPEYLKKAKELLEPYKLEITFP